MEKIGRKKEKMKKKGKEIKKWEHRRYKVKNIAENRENIRIIFKNRAFNIDIFQKISYMKLQEIRLKSIQIFHDSEY